MSQFCFLSGEFSVSLPLCMKQKSRWDHYTNSSKLIGLPGGGSIVKSGKPYSGVLWYCSTDDEELAEKNLNEIISSGVKCWPNPKWLLHVNNRFKNIDILKPILNTSIQHGNKGQIKMLRCPSVVKVGNVHCGEGKFRVENQQEFDSLMATISDGEQLSIEPFYSGRSYRVFVSGLTNKEEVVVLRYDNDQDWIKNNPGCDVVEDDSRLTQETKDTAIAIHRHMNSFEGILEQGTLMSGIDYVVDENNEWNFLEWNQFPGVGMNDKLVEIAKKTFQAAIIKIEEIQ